MMIACVCGERVDNVWASECNGCKGEERVSVPQQQARSTRRIIPAAVAPAPAPVVEPVAAAPSPYRNDGIPCIVREALLSGDVMFVRMYNLYR